MTQPAPGVNTGVLRDREGRVQHQALARTPTGVEYRSIGLAGPCPGCGRRLCYGAPAHHLKIAPGYAHINVGDLVYCPWCKACHVIGNDLGLTRVETPTDPTVARALSACIGRCKVEYPGLFAKPKPAPPPPASSPAQAFSGVGTRRPTTTNRPTRDSERRDIA